MADMILIISVDPNRSLKTAAAQVNQLEHMTKPGTPILSGYSIMRDVLDYTDDTNVIASYDLGIVEQDKDMFQVMLDSYVDRFKAHHKGEAELFIQ
jgi:hypothetical protein